MSSSDSYPEWPDGLGDPRVNAHAASLPHTTVNRHEVITKFRARDEAAEKKPRAPKKRPHLREYQGIQFQPSRCSFHYHCRGALATKHCHSCAKFGRSRLGYYCDACFTARHPEYRLPHTWTPVKDATNQDEEWVAHITRHHLEQDAAELKLLLTDMQAFLARSSPPVKAEQLSPHEDGSTPQLSSTSTDFKKAYATAARIYSTLRDLMVQNHDQLEQKPPLTREEAVAKMQSMWKIRKARKQLKTLVREVYASLEDPTTGQTYYYNKYTKETQWTKPAALGSEALPISSKEISKKPKVVFATREEEELHAVLKLQAMARTHLARRHMRKLISSVYEKIWDASTQRFYYHNTKTKEVKWEKPRWVSDEDLLTPRTRYAQLLHESESRLEKKNMSKARREPLTPDEAARMVQRAYRLKTGFRNLLRMCRAVYERIYDPEQGMYYYHNTRTKETTWEKPLLLRGAASDVFTPRTRQKKAHEEMLTPERAAQMVQRAYRRRKGFQNLLRLCRSVYERIYDTEQGMYYYHNTRTKETTWEKPLLLRGAESDVFTPRTRQKKLKSLMSAMDGTSSRKSHQWTEEEAAIRLQGLYRAKKAREELGVRLVQRFKQAVDPGSGQVYYVNLLTQEVSWDPPALAIRSGAQIEAFAEEVPQLLQR